MQLITSLLDIFHHICRISTSPRSYLFCAAKSCAGLLFVICFFWVISAFTLAQAATADPINLPDYLDMPSEYGEVIYRINPQSPKQLYIIAISHRDPDSGANSGTTVQTQMEIFRIGEWLKNTTHLNLLLPEGYFNGTKARSIDTPSAIQAISHSEPELLDNALLHKRLAADKPFVNAEMLLMEYLSFHASQVEDRNIYDAVRNSLGNLKTSNAQHTSPADNVAEIKYLQEIRTAQLLQAIPTVIEDEFQSGAIGDRSALFTVGLNHIKDIFRYMENDRIHIASPQKSNIQPDILSPKLHLTESGYGVTIIIPRTLANNRKLLQMTRIDQILLTDNTYSRQALRN